MMIWIDADACPKMVKEIIFNASIKRSVPVTLVANSNMFIPMSPLISIVVVGDGLDVADKFIVDNSKIGDLVITADIPLASFVVDKGVVAINPRGDVYTEENVKEVLATRNLMQDLRSFGELRGGPPPLGPKDKAKFASGFDRELTRLLKNR